MMYEMTQENLAIGLIILMVGALVLVLVAVKKGLDMVMGIINPIQEWQEKEIIKRLEEESEKQQLERLRAWTVRQQDDLGELNRGLIIVASAVEALIDHAIVKQEGNGKCHRAQQRVEAFLEEKALQMKSHD